MYWSLPIAPAAWCQAKPRKIHIAWSTTGCHGRSRIRRKHKRSSQILQLAVHFSWEIKIPAKRKRWSRCSISTGLLLAAAFLFLLCAFSSSGVSRHSQLLKKHTAAPQHTRVGARGWQQEGGWNLRQFRETLAVSSLEDTELPRFGARSHLLALGCRNSCPSGSRGPPGSPGRGRGGGPMWAGSPRLGTKQRDRFGGPRPSLGQHCISSHFHTCGFVGIPGCIPMNRELLSARGQLPSPAITPPSAWGRDPGRLGTPSSPSYIKSTTTTKRFQWTGKKCLATQEIEINFTPKKAVWFCFTFWSP